MVKFLRKVSYLEQEKQFYTKDKTALHVILSNCTKPRMDSRYLYGDGIFSRKLETGKKKDKRRKLRPVCPIV